MGDKLRKFVRYCKKKFPVYFYSGCKKHHEVRNKSLYQLKSDINSFSLVSGYYSWRNNVDGSWFVQALCRVLREMGDDTELMYMMTLVNSLVASDFRACTDSEFTQSARQMPCLVSMLTAQVFFRPK